MAETRNCEEFFCPSSAQCILKTRVCDGVEDCIDGSDEINENCGNLMFILCFWMCLFSYHYPSFLLRSLPWQFMSTSSVTISALDSGVEGVLNDNRKRNKQYFPLLRITMVPLDLKSQLCLWHCTPIYVFDRMKWNYKCKWLSQQALNEQKGQEEVQKHV